MQVDLDYINYSPHMIVDGSIVRELNAIFSIEVAVNKMFLQWTQVFSIAKDHCIVIMLILSLYDA